MSVIKLQEAYETLYDEHKRRLYDAKCCFPQQGFGSTQQGPQAHQQSNEDVVDESGVEERDREWSAQAQSRASNIKRLRQDLSALEATFNEMQFKERERKMNEDSDTGLLGYLSSFWSAKPAKTKEEKRKEELERTQQQTRTSVRLRMAKFQLQQAEQEHLNRLREQDHIKFEESLKKRKARTQKEQEARNRRAREQEEAARAREAAFKKAQDEARQRHRTEERRRREQQDNERRERDLRQELLDRLAKQNGRGNQPGQNESRFSSSAAPKSANTNAFPRSRRPTQHTPNSGAQRRVCRHKKFWPKVNGRHECSICLKIFHSFVLQCPDCNIMACAPCRRSLKGP